MAFIPKYLSFHLAIGLILHLVQGNEEISLGVDFHPSKYVEIAVQKSSFTLNCSVTSTDKNRPLTYIWHKDGVPLTSQQRPVILNNGSLYIKRIRKNKKWNDEGKYQCIASNSIGKILAPVILLKIRSIEKFFTKEPSPWQGYLGGVARFECNINSVPPPSYVWQKDKKNIPQNDRYTTFSSGVLQITNLKYEDAGMYRCIAYSSGSVLGRTEVTSNFKNKNSKEGQLTVLNRKDRQGPRMLAPPQNNTGIIGESTVLECLIGGKPLPGVIWTRKDKLSVSGVRYGSTNLKFDKLKATDEGIYICTSNSTAYPNVHSEAVLTVLSPPKVVTALKSQKWPVARNVIFDCVISGVPKPDIKWFLNGQPVDKTNERLDVRSDKLVVLSADPTHSGYYQCVGENSVGQNMSTAYLEIFKTDGAPEPPNDVNGSAVSSSEILLKWSPTDSQLLTYMVLYSKALGQLDTTFVQIPECRVKELDAHTNYTLFVKSVNKMGVSPASKSVTILTKEDVPVVAPKITMYSTQANNIEVSWDELKPEEARGVIAKYKIYFRKTSDLIQYDDEIDGNRKSYLITGLEPDTDYEVRVKAATSVGYPDLPDTNWPWVKYQTPEYYGAHIPLPPKLRFTFVNSTSASFTWEQKGSDENTSFELTFRNLKTDTTILDKVVLKAPESSYVLSNLENNTAYEVTMVATNAQGSSSPASKEFSTSDNGVPEPPDNVDSEAISSNTVLLSWSSGRREYDTMYEVCYYPTNSENSLKCQESVTNNARITNLKPFTDYSFKIRTKIVNQDSMFSRIVSIQTKQDVPSAPTNITWEIVSTGIVEIKWDPPSEPNGVITSYIIFYNHDNSLPDKKWNNVTKKGVITTARVDELTAASYYVKLSACTEAGQGNPSPVITVYPGSCVDGHHDTCKDASMIGSFLTRQEVGIIIGVTIGVLCIIICILVIVFRRKFKMLFRCFYNEDHLTLPPPTYHGNGHLPRTGNGHVNRSSEHIPMDQHDADAFTPMLTKLPENEQSDSKGGGNMIVTPNGVRTRGFNCQNGHIANGHVPTFPSSNNSHLDVSSNREQEHHGLMAAMLAATDGSVTGEGSESAANSSSVMEGDSGSLEDIDRSVGSVGENFGTATPQLASPNSLVDGDPCVIEAATLAVITDTGQPTPNISPQHKQHGSLLRNKYHQSTSTSPSRVNKELPPPPPDPPRCSNTTHPDLTLNSIPARVHENSLAPHQIQTTVRDGRTVSAAKNSHSVV
ncbi:protogenin isoform X1 [Patella vulgata]|uniref:protogenin isoform X1 n=2 Tax=Patella vulgata TaxID=6465 RepID=UPI0024A9B33A|nr:protogenin isoform X1 [Patella vulgata]